MTKLISRVADRTVVISDGLRSAYIRSGTPPLRLSVVRDAADRVEVEPRRVEEIRQRLNLPKSRFALYVGRIARDKGVDSLAAASAHTATPIVVIGDGPMRQELSNRYPNVQFISQTSYEDLPYVLASAAVLVIPNSATSQDMATFTSPLKAFAYIAAQKPIVASRVPALEEIFKDQVVYAEPDSPRSLAHAIDTAAAPPKLQVYSWLERARDLVRVSAL
ncbi:glycosyltransferase [Patescibacteria group bacterium]|nr:glycosyltransferase [Patescibacteria group bacterium]